jgi:1-deoxy-D-xylulose 5-phosphate reductoisomerase
VDAFLDRHLNFMDIAKVSEAVLAKMTGGPIRGLDDVLEADAEARRLARERIPTLQNCERGAHA